MDPQAQAQLGQLEAAVNQFFSATDPAVKTQIGPLADLAHHSC